MWTPRVVPLAHTLAPAHPCGCPSQRQRWGTATRGGGHAVGTGTPCAAPGADPIPLRRGVVRVDIELRDVAIDQCSSGPGWFADTHRCDLNSTQVSATGTPHPAPRPLTRRGRGSPTPNRPRPPIRAVPAACPSLRAELYPLLDNPSASFSCSQRRSREVYCANLPSPLPAAACDPAAPCPGTAGDAQAPGGWQPMGKSPRPAAPGAHPGEPVMPEPRFSARHHRQHPQPGQTPQLPPIHCGSGSHPEGKKPSQVGKVSPASLSCQRCPPEGRALPSGISPENNNTQKNRQPGPSGAGCGRGGLGQQCPACCCRHGRAGLVRSAALGVHLGFREGFGGQALAFNS